MDRRYCERRKMGISELSTSAKGRVSDMKQSSQQKVQGTPTSAGSMELEEEEVFLRTRTNYYYQKLY